MFSHVMVGVSDLDASRKFYDALLGTLPFARLKPPDAEAADVALAARLRHHREVACRVLAIAGDEAEVVPHQRALELLGEAAEDVERRFLVGHEDVAPHRGVGGGDAGEVAEATTTER